MMEEKIVRFLNEHNMMITTVESCTGGLIAARLVNVSGASNVFSEGYITYSEDAKAKMVGVNPETIKIYNVVSEEVAYEMASGGAKPANEDEAVSVTGVAGPLGGTKDIPVGTVCIGVYYKNKVITEKFLFNGDRLQVRNQAVDKALEMVWNEFNNR